MRSSRSPWPRGPPTQRFAQRIWPTPSPSASACGCTPARWNGRWPEPRSPKGEAPDERIQHCDADVERYEQLRHQALGGEPSGWRLGLGVVCHRGVAAWLRAWHSVASAPTVTAPAETPDRRVGSDELVGVLAAMALAALGR
jgi:hypothetical protein